MFYTVRFTFKGETDEDVFFDTVKAIFHDLDGSYVRDSVNFRGVPGEKVCDVSFNFDNETTSLDSVIAFSKTHREILGIATVG